MTTPQVPESSGEKQDTRYKKGQSGNPSGKPQGTRNRMTLLAEKMMQDDAEDVVKVVLASAKGGDMVAARLVLERLIPPARERPLSIALPTVATVGDIPAALGAILEDVARGALLPGEGGALCGMLGAVSKAFETAELSRRLETIERQLSLGPEHG